MRTTGIHTQMEDVRRPRTPMTTAARARGGEVLVSKQLQEYKVVVIVEFLFVCVFIFSRDSILQICISHICALVSFIPFFIAQKVYRLRPICFLSSSH